MDTSNQEPISINRVNLKPVADGANPAYLNT